MFYNLPVLYPFGFFETLFALSDNITNDFSKEIFVPSLEQVSLPTENKVQYIYNYDLAVSSNKKVDYYIDWMLLYPIVSESVDLKTKSFSSINIEFDEIITKNDLIISVSNEYWSVFSRYPQDGNFTLFYYFNLTQPLSFLPFIEFELTPFYIFLTGVAPVLSEVLIVGNNKFGLLPEYLLSDLSIHL